MKNPPTLFSEKFSPVTTKISIMQKNIDRSRSYKPLFERHDSRFCLFFIGGFYKLKWAN